jgi:hypothetical protein
MERWRDLPWTHRLKIRLWGGLDRFVTFGLDIDP